MSCFVVFCLFLFFFPCFSFFLFLKCVYSIFICLILMLFFPEGYGTRGARDLRTRRSEELTRGPGDAGTKKIKNKKRGKNRMPTLIKYSI